MNKQRIKRLLEGYQKGTLTEVEHNQVEQWLNSLRKEDEDNITLTDDEVKQMFADIRQTIKSQSKVRNLQPHFWLKIAASALLVVAAAYTLWQYAGARKNLIEVTSAGVVRKVVLSDSSLVWLRGNSRLVYYEKRGENGRFAELEGEGFFEIKKDPARPFIIQCADNKVKVLGTSFNLKTTNGTLELKVLTGKVNVSSSTDAEGINVTPKQQLSFSDKRETAIRTLTTDELSVVAESTEYNMKFDHTDMAEVLARVEGKFGVSVKLENSELNKCTVTADLTDQSLFETMRMLAGALEFEYEIGNGVVTIHGGSCQ